MDTAPPPPPSVRHALGAPAGRRLLPGGSGRTWVAGDVVLKPAEGPQAAAWTADVLAVESFPAHPALGQPASVEGAERPGALVSELIAARQPLLTPARDADPAVFDRRRRLLAVALGWAARSAPRRSRPPGATPGATPEG